MGNGRVNAGAARQVSLPDGRVLFAGRRSVMTASFKLPAEGLNLEEVEPLMPALERANGPRATERDRDWRSAVPESTEVRCEGATGGDGGKGWVDWHWPAA